MSRELIDYPSAEVAVIAWLRQKLADRGHASAVGSKRTTNTPGRYVRVTRTGGVVANMAQDRPVLTFECWGNNDVEALELAQETRLLVQSLYGDRQGSAVLSWRSEAAGPVSFPHPDTLAPRYQHTQELTVDAVAG